MHIRGVETYNMDVYGSSRRLDKMDVIQRVDPVHRHEQTFMMKNKREKDKSEFVFKPVKVKSVNGTGSRAVGIQVKLMHRDDQILFNGSINAKLAYGPIEEVAGKNIDYVI